MKKQPLLIGTASLAVLALAAVVFSAVHPYASKDQDVHVTQTRLIYDPSNPREVAGTFDDIFIGRVVEQVGTKNPEEIVQTLYTVDVLDVLKGGLKGRVTVSQLGGYFDGEWHLFTGDTGAATETLTAKDLEASFLKPGYTYLFATSPNPERGWQVVSTDPSGLMRLEIDPSVEPEKARQAAMEDPRIAAMKEAIAHQILPSSSAK